MIHEVMVLDHSGPDLAFIEYAGALRLWATGLLVVNLLPFRSGYPLCDLFLCGLALFGWAGVVGVLESSMARLRLNHIPLLLGVAFVLSVLSLFWVVK
jgi:formate hydrogenlyase subunit 4